MIHDLEEFLKILTRSDFRKMLRNISRVFSASLKLKIKSSLGDQSLMVLLLICIKVFNLNRYRVPCSWVEYKDY